MPVEWERPRFIKNYGRLDILVNNSGVYEVAPIEAITEEHVVETG